mmetsp:Transcript_31976/g.74912  ORF Transcript_31976/g.74912 Transcript_31976/m.74912 type:complete len:227 (+) Transcript_31976:419-1099(+)
MEVSIPTLMATSRTAFLASGKRNSKPKELAWYQCRNCRKSMVSAELNHFSLATLTSETLRPSTRKVCRMRVLSSWMLKVPQPSRSYRWNKSWRLFTVRTSISSVFASLATSETLGSSSNLPGCSTSSESMTFLPEIDFWSSFVSSLSMTAEDLLPPLSILFALRCGFCTDKRPACTLSTGVLDFDDSRVLDFDGSRKLLLEGIREREGSAESAPALCDLLFPAPWP